MFRETVKSKIQEELRRGAEARSQGFEGRARVCARRAAGAAVREYLDMRGLPAPGPSAYDLLAYLQELPGLPVVLGEAARNLLLKVDESFHLPVEVDLLAEAAWLVRALEEFQRES
jgi:hypothetical protein